MEAKPKRGRPRKHQEQQDRVKAWRKKQEGRRLDGYVSNKASWRLQRLADEWGCSIAGAVDRLAVEADEKYGAILFPETELSQAVLDHLNAFIDSLPDEVG